MVRNNLGNVAANPLYFADKVLFGRQEITSLKFPDTVTKVGLCFLRNEKLESVEIGSGVTLIGEARLIGCGFAEKRYGGKMRISVGELAFGMVNLQTADIGNRSKQ